MFNEVLTHIAHLASTPSVTNNKSDKGEKSDKIDKDDKETAKHSVRLAQSIQKAEYMWHLVRKVYLINDHQSKETMKLISMTLFHIFILF